MNTLTRSWVSALSLAASLCLPTLLLAEDPAPKPPAESSTGAKKRPDRPGGDRTEAMRAQREAWVKEIGASEEQMTKIREAMKGQSDQGRELRAKTDLSNEERRAKMLELRAGTTAKIKGILTPDQFAKYEKLQEERREQMSRGEGRRPQPGGPKPGGPKPDGAKPDASK